MNKVINVSFRLGTEEDSELIMQLIYELAEYEKLLDQVTTDAEKVRKSIVNKEFETLFACFDDGTVAGYAMFFPDYASLVGKQGLFRLSGGDAALGEDAETHDLPGGADVRSAAEFFGEAAHGNHSHLAAVLLAEEGHCSALLRLVDAHDLGADLKVVRDLLVDDLLDSADLLSGHGFAVGEVEAGSLRVLVGSGLLDMITKHLP